MHLGCCHHWQFGVVRLHLVSYSLMTLAFAPCGTRKSMNDLNEALRKSTVLVVDDHPTNLKLASDVLESEGYHILKAMDAEKAVVIIDNSPPDLILMDLSLPGMDGLTLTRKLKDNDKTKHIVIVALTASAMKGDEHKAHAAGCDGYITKPIDTRRLPHQVAEFLGRTEIKRTTE